MRIGDGVVNITDYKNNKVLKIWHQRHKEKGYKKFVYDGIVDLSLWKNSPQVCFFLKEAHLKEDLESENLCNMLKDYDIWRMWKVVADWIYGICNTTISYIPAFTKIRNDNEDNPNKRVRSSAIINIKKSNGMPSSEHNDLMRYVGEDSDLIKEQFNEIDPQIIVCGNTAYYFELIFGYNPKQRNSFATYNGQKILHKDFLEKGYVWAGNTLIIDFCHPANRFDRKGKYYALCALYQQALIGRKEGGL